MGLLDEMENKAVTSMLGNSSNQLATSLLQMTRVCDKLSIKQPSSISPCTLQRA